MKILRRILAFILLLVLTLVCIGFLLPQRVNVERTAFMNVKRSLIYSQVNEPSKWKSWAPWFQDNLLLKIEKFGPTQGNESVLLWQSRNSSRPESGKLIILSSNAYDSIVFEMDFTGYGKTSGIFRFADSASGTNVSWKLESEIGKNPVSRWFGLFTNRMVGPDLEKGLRGLLKISLAIRNSDNVVISEVIVPERVILSVRDTCDPRYLSSKTGKMFRKISGFIKQKGLKVAGNPLTIYHSFSRDIFDIESAIPVCTVINETRDVKCRILPVQKAVRACYSGSYDKISIAYEEIQKYLNDKYLSVSGPGWEVYQPGSGRESDTMPSQTDIYYPVK